MNKSAIINLQMKSFRNKSFNSNLAQVCSSNNMILNSGDINELSYEVIEEANENIEKEVL